MPASTIECARDRVASSKRWGRTCERAILGGYWDGGSLVRDAVLEIEAEDARSQKAA